MDMYRVNLSLLVALDELLTLKSVTQTAKKMCLTQASMSNNLQQLRVIFNDPLLVREKNYMVLTNYAKELKPKLHKVLQEMHSLMVCGQRFEPSTSERFFTLGMNDYMTSLLMPSLLKTLEHQAPHLKIKIVSDTHIGASTVFENGEYELALGKGFGDISHLSKQLLFKDVGVCVLNPRHPLAKKKKITLEEYLSCDHIAIQTDHPHSPRLIEEALAKQNVYRRIKIATPFVAPIFEMLAQSETLMGSMIQRVVDAHQDQGRFVIKPLPFEIGSLEFYMVWHPRYDEDLGHRWLREQIASVFSK